MKRRTSEAYGHLIARGTNTIKGLHDKGVGIGVVVNNEAVMTGVVNAARKAQAEYRDALVASLAATAVLNVHFDKAGTFIALARDVLKPKYGTRYNQTWSTVGFSGNSLKVPDSIGQRSTLLGSIELFFAAEPALEVAGLATAALARALREGLMTAIAAAADAKVVQRQKKGVRDAALATVRMRITALRNELKPLLAKDDPRWLDFGFGVPTDVHVPEAPQGVTLTLDAGRVKVSWSHTVYADHYRVYQRVAGLDTVYKPVGTTTGTSFDLGTFASGAHIDVQVTAINSAGESVPSAAAQLVIP